MNIEKCEKTVYRKKENRVWIVLWMNKWIILITTVLFLLVGVLYASKQDASNIYQARTSLSSVMYQTNQEDNKETDVIYQNVVRDYSDLAQSKRVCERAETLIGNANLSAQNLEKSMHIVVNKEKTCMEIVVEQKTAQLSVVAANALAQSFVLEMEELCGENSVQIIDEANSAVLLKDGYVYWLKRILMLGVLGFVLSVGYFILEELFSGKLKHMGQLQLQEGEKLFIVPYVPKETEDGGKDNRIV